MKIGDAQIIQGDALAVLRTLLPESVNCCVTSPPYWGLRDYGIPPQVWDGLPDCMHDFSETINPGGNGDGVSFRRDKLAGIQRGSRRQPGFCKKCGAWRGSLGLEPTPELYVKHIVAVFDEVRRVLMKDGTCWINIGDSYAGSGKAGNNIEYWGLHKQFGKVADVNTFGPAMFTPPPGYKPKDLFGIPWMIAFALRAAGWWLRQDIIWNKPNPMPESVRDRCTKSHEYVFMLTKAARYYFNAEAIKEPCESGDSDIKKMNEQKDRIGGKHKVLVDHFSKASSSTNIGQKMAVGDPGGRNKRSVWEITTCPFPEAHFATYPEKLVEPCILAGCPPDGVVLDPFLGSGTTGIVALRLGRRFAGIELKPEYMAMAERRIREAWKNRPALFPAAEVEPAAPELFQDDLENMLDNEVDG